MLLDGLLQPSKDTTDQTEEPSKQALATVESVGNLLRSRRLVVRLEPLIQVGLVIGRESSGAARQDLGALGQAVDVVDAEQAQTDVASSKVLE